MIVDEVETLTTDGQYVNFELNIHNCIMMTETRRFLMMHSEIIVAHLNFHQRLYGHRFYFIPELYGGGHCSTP